MDDFHAYFPTYWPSIWGLLDSWKLHLLRFVHYWCFLEEFFHSRISLLVSISVHDDHFRIFLTESTIERFGNNLKSPHAWRNLIPSSCPLIFRKYASFARCCRATETHKFSRQLPSNDWCLPGDLFSLQNSELQDEHCESSGISFSHFYWDVQSAFSSCSSSHSRWQWPLLFFK